MNMIGKRLSRYINARTRNDQPPDSMRLNIDDYIWKILYQPENNHVFLRGISWDICDSCEKWIKNEDNR